MENERSYCIQRTPIIFPCKAYPTQLAIMDKILKALTRRQNCLIESPTGTGKSLALLISCLAWQRNLTIDDDEIDLNSMPTANNDMLSPGISEKSEVRKKFSDDLDDFQPQKKFRPSAMQNEITDTGQTYIALEVKTENGIKNYMLDASSSESSSILCHCPKETLILPANKIYKTQLEGQTFKFAEENNLIESNESYLKASIKFEDGNFHEYPIIPVDVYKSKQTVLNSTNSLRNDFTNFNIASSSSSSPPSSNNLNPTSSLNIKRIPQIYFGTRTHKQITQIIQELRKTVYRNVRMCILSSRDRTCIHETVSKSFDKNKGCKELLEEVNGSCCKYYQKSQEIQFDRLKLHGLEECWDIEDLVKVGKKLKACPYFGLRNLLQADIIFCPYNYIIDPLIRESMQINLKNSILILDEAHNIEDSARDAASFNVTEEELDSALFDINNLSYHGFKTYSHEVVVSVLEGLKSWINKNEDNLLDYEDFTRTGKVWSGEELVAMLSEIKAGPEDYDYIQKHFTIASTEDKTDKNYKRAPLNDATVALINGLLMIFGFLYSNHLTFMPDYRAVIIREIINNKQLALVNGFFGRNSKGWINSLKIWCLNPAVAFSSFKHDIHSIIVSSGTLSPMTTFQSELDLEFPICLEANHIINKEQVWIGSIGCGPNGGFLKAIHNQVDTFSFQDELGQLILQVCQVIPHGVLCFFTSYSMMEKLCNRWKITNVWEKIEAIKRIVCEPKKTDKINFESTITEFYDNITNENSRGSIFFAVFRGKISEGINFSDDHARAIISVGIPYPHLKDIQVDLKRKYNDKFCLHRQLMSGKEWYETQAFRALNQALGRCIRHRNDWGALILVDSRFANKSYTKGLSKWIRNHIDHYHDFQRAVSSLSQFVSGRLVPSAASGRS